MENKKRAQVTIQNYDSAVKTLKRFLSIPVLNDRDRAGVIQAFEFT